MIKLSRRTSKNSTIIALVILAVIIMSAVIGMNRQLAYGDSWGDGEVADYGNCISPKAETNPELRNKILQAGGGKMPTNWSDTCFGAYWDKYSVDSNPLSTWTQDAHPKAVSEIARAQSSCKAIGATDYYRLALAVYDVNNSWQYSGHTLNLGQGQTVEVTVNQLFGQFPPTRYLSNVGLDMFGEVKPAYDIAAQHLGNLPAWENTSVFCWNDDWGTPPDVPKPPVTGSGDGEVKSRSTVKVTGDASTRGGTYTSDWDGDVVYEFSTDEDTVELTFWHEMDYQISLTPPAVNDPDEYNGCKGKTTSTGNIKDENGASKGSLTLTAGCDNSSASSTPVTFKVKLNRGDVIKQCREIAYKPKYTQYSLESEPFQYTYSCDKNGRPSECVGEATRYWHEYSGSSGNGASSACVIITRPEEPIQEKAPESPWSKGAGVPSSDPMYAGETTKMGWTINATSHPTRRIMAYEAIKYLVSSDRPSDGIVDGTVADEQEPVNHYNTSSPCSYFRGWEQCSTFSEHSGTWNASETAKQNFNKSAEISMAVPNLVGHKYCNSYGIKYQFWFRITGDPSQSSSWQTGRTYWNIYDSACRTIAKKPTIAFWNSSLFASGNVTTSLASRHTGIPLFGQEASGDLTAFGSWAENLAIVGKDITGFTSGAVLSRGFSRQQLSVGKNSKPLTISNVGSTNGQSQVGGNSAFYTRLVQYLTLKANTPVGDLNNLNTSNISGTKIIYVGGDLAITNDIILPKNYSNIYEIPQVVLIVDGNVNVDPKVTRIDAWIIAPSGKLDTCSGYVASKGNPGGTDTKTTHTGWGLCDSQLTFNGPVMVGSIALNRTGGADPMVSDGQQASGSDRQRYTPAEVFNLSAEVYLWSYAQAGRYGSSYSEAYSRELPPRY